MTEQAIQNALDLHTWWLTGMTLTVVVSLLVNAAVAVLQGVNLVLLRRDQADTKGKVEKLEKADETRTCVVHDATIRQHGDQIGELFKRVREIELAK